MALRRKCYLCGAKIKKKFVFCIDCAKAHGMYQQPRKNWPVWALNLVRALERERKARKRHPNESIDTEEGSLVLAQATALAFFQQGAAKYLPLDLVLKKYKISLDEFVILTEKPKVLAPVLGVSRKSLYNHRARLKRRVLATLAVGA